MTFYNNDDVWKVVKLLIKEVKNNNKVSSKKFDIAKSLIYQIPHFACYNFLLNKEYQKDISKYMLSKNHNVPAYDGCYSNQPYKWVKKLFTIESAMNQLKKIELDKIKKQGAK